MASIKDFTFGIKMEKKLYKHHLKHRYPNVVWNTPIDKWSKFDFTTGKKLIELKSRRYYKKKWDKEGHMCELSKIEYLEEHPEVIGYIYYMYYDGLYRVKISKDILQVGIQKRHGGRTDRGRDERKIQAYIDGKYLKLVSKKIKCPLPPHLSEECLL